MKKFGTFALLVCLLVLGVAAVLSITNPELQPKFLETGKAALDAVLEFLKRVAEDFWSVFIRKA